jgi:hypothetical protein
MRNKSHTVTTEPEGGGNKGQYISVTEPPFCNTVLAFVPHQRNSTPRPFGHILLLLLIIIIIIITVVISAVGLWHRHISCWSMLMM